LDDNSARGVLIFGPISPAHAWSSQAAELLRAHLKTVEKRVRASQLPGFKLGPLLGADGPAGAPQLQAELVKLSIRMSTRAGPRLADAAKAAGVSRPVLLSGTPVSPAAASARRRQSGTHRLERTAPQDFEQILAPMPGRDRLPS